MSGDWYGYSDNKIIFNSELIQKILKEKIPNSYIRKNDDKKCAIKECNRKTHSKDYCERCYKTILRYKNSGLEKKELEKKKTIELKIRHNESYDLRTFKKVIINLNENKEIKIIEKVSKKEDASHMNIDLDNFL
jgi:hypothetical protein